MWRSLKAFRRIRTDRVQRAVYGAADGRIYGFGTPVRKATRSLRLCSRGDDCPVINRYLFLQGYLNERQVIEEITENSVKALKQYQKDNGLHQTCQVDMETRALMEQDPVFTDLILSSQR